MAQWTLRMGLPIWISLIQKLTQTCPKLCLLGRFIETYNLHQQLDLFHVKVLLRKHSELLRSQHVFLCSPGLNQSCKSLPGLCIEAHLAQTDLCFKCLSFLQHCLPRADHTSEAPSSQIKNSSLPKYFQSITNFHILLFGFQKLFSNHQIS